MKRGEDFRGQNAEVLFFQRAVDGLFIKKIAMCIFQDQCIPAVRRTGDFTGRKICGDPAAAAVLVK